MTLLSHIPVDEAAPTAGHVWPRPDNDPDGTATNISPAGDSEAPTLLILGTRGVPARHGGFETFAERLAIHLHQRGWNVTVACQSERPQPDDVWNGVRRRFHVGLGSSELGSIVFDALSVISAVVVSITARGRRPLILTLGYNTAIFGVLFRLFGVTNIVNMDGVEWRRAKWSGPIKAWFWMNERIGAFLADHMIADHPAIAEHLLRHADPQKITVIPYGAEPVVDAPESAIAALGLSAKNFVLVIARPEPENSLLEIVTAYASRPRDCRLVVVGNYHPERNAYHAEVMAAGGPETLFAGAIYDAVTLAALRHHARLYVHGHTVGGTNPSLVEALGAGVPILAHDNVYNRWVAGPRMSYFSDIPSCAEALDELLSPEGLEVSCEAIRVAARQRFETSFTWPRVLTAYESLLLNWMPEPRLAKSEPGPATAPTTMRGQDAAVEAPMAVNFSEPVRAPATTRENEFGPGPTAMTAWTTSP